VTHVTALLVSHDGERWLGPVLDGVEQQSRPVDRAVAVESGTGGASLALLRRRLTEEAVLTVSSQTTYAGSVRAGLDALGAQDDADEWIWLLHDDSRPSEDCLEQLLTAREEHPSATIVGPKLREWPSLRRLLEVGVSLSHTGRRETGLERGEYDQGQHDQISRVLAVNTAGMLVRRDVLERLGFDDALPVTGTDVDFGWRAARAGYTTVVAPAAVVFHAEAAHRGLRASSLTRHIRRSERIAAFYTLATNVSLARLPLVLLRVLVFGLLRVVGLLLIRAPGEAWDELVSVSATLLRPWRIVRGRRRRRRTNVLGAHQVAFLLPPWWLPLRVGFDHLVEILRTLVSLVIETPAPTEIWEEDAEQTEADGAFSTLRAILTSRAFLIGTALTIAALVAAQGLLTGVPVGGALPPAINGPSHLWATYVESWHPLGVGSNTPAAPYVLPLAAAAFLLGGHTDWVVQILLLMAVPLSALGALRLARRLLASGIPAIWATVTYALLPVATGSVQQGRLGTVVFLIVLPHLVAVLVDLTTYPERDRRRRAVWRAALWLALAAAFAPVVLVLAGVALVLVLATLVPIGGRPGLRAALQAGWSLVIAFLLLAPWSLSVWFLGNPLSWFTEAGWQVPGLIGSHGSWDLLLGRPGSVGAAPAWLSVAVVVAAIGAVVRTSGRGPAVVSWAVTLFGLTTAAALSYLRVVPPGGSQPQPIWVGVPTVLAFAALIFSGAVAGTRLRAALAGRSFGWSQPLTLLVALAAIAVPLGTLGWWLVVGSGGPLTVQPSSNVPAYLLQAGSTRGPDGTLEIEGAQDHFTYTVLRGHEIGLGDESVLPTASTQEQLTQAVATLISRPSVAAASAVAGYGVRYVYLPNPADTAVSAAFDSAAGAFSPASALRPGSRTWELVPTARNDALVVTPDRTRPWLVGGQLIGLLLAVVLAAPSRRRVR
jgi:GT2 family glycosyltransferase